MRTLAAQLRSISPISPHTSPSAPRVAVACPDARQPAYRAVAGLRHAGYLSTFHTSYFHQGDPLWLRTFCRLAPRSASRIAQRLRRRCDREIAGASIRAHSWIDAVIALENRLSGTPLRRGLAKTRTAFFDQALARAIESERPDALLVFSDVGSEVTLATCRRARITSVLSVVHGDPDDEVAVLEREACSSPEWFPLYLGDGRLDMTELRWLHERRRGEAKRADLIVVPSEFLAQRMAQRGIHAERIRVVPYAADIERFRPRPRPTNPDQCTFVFAGGLTQRKGIGYLLEAWKRIRRPGWKLRLIGHLPQGIGALKRHFEQPGVHLTGGIAYSDMPAQLAEADVFVFPSLFEGSAVVTYEALACGLPCIVTPESGSVARDGVEGLTVPAANVEALAQAMAQLGQDPSLRRALGQAARARAEQFTWQRYQSALIDLVRDLTASAEIHR